jgi:hypothetical protein
MQTRRDHLRSVLGGMTGLAIRGVRAGAEENAARGILFDGFAVPPRRGVQEATLTPLPGGRYWLLFGEKQQLVGKLSKDGGRTWSDTAPVRTVDKGSIPLARDTAHLSVVRLKSGRLGTVYGGPAARPGRDGTVLFRSSGDDGRTWSVPVAIDPFFAVCRTQAARVLSTGRVVVPVMAWISPQAGGESEDENKS